MSCVQNIENKQVVFTFGAPHCHSGLNRKLQGAFCTLQFSCCSKYIELGRGDAPRESPCLTRGLDGLGLDKNI
jgi:hypothetical protein